MWAPCESVENELDESFQQLFGFWAVAVVLESFLPFFFRQVLGIALEVAQVSSLVAVTVEFGVKLGGPDRRPGDPQRLQRTRRARGQIGVFLGDEQRPPKRPPRRPGLRPPRPPRRSSSVIAPSPFWSSRWKRSLPRSYSSAETRPQSSATATVCSDLVSSLTDSARSRHTLSAARKMLSEMLTCCVSLKS